MRKFWLHILPLLLLASVPLAAQDNTTVISLAVPEFQEDAFTDELLAQFEALHPGVRVEVRASEMGGAAPAASEIEAHLEDLQAYVASADVLLVDNNTLSLEATRAGLLMNLGPLAEADPTLNAGDFLPQVWQSFQWDRGIWALPVTADVVLLLYNPAAFDAAGIAYPNEGWTMEDFAIAARALTITDADGEVTPGFFDYGTSSFMLRSLLGTSLTDAAAAETTPDFSNPALEDLLTTWVELSDEGALGSVGMGMQIMIIGGSANEGPPMTIQRSFGLATFPGNGNEARPAGSLLPGGFAGLEVQGFAVSAGTREPMLAYELAKFLTNSAEIATGLIGSTPARRSLIGAEVEPAGQGGGPGRGFRLASLNYSPEAQAIIDRGFAKTLPAAEMVFVDYMRAALDLMQTEGLDARSALQQMEAQAVANLNRAAELRGTAIIAVATPVPQVQLAANEIELNFGIGSFIMPLPNADRWQQVIDQFVANDPEVGRINMDVQPAFSLDDMAGQFDCFYMPTNAVPGGNLSAVISLDPFLDADPAFDRNDIAASVLEQIQFDNRTWAYPLAITPEVLRYHTDLFAAAGVPLPENGWTTDQFVDALRALKPTPDDPTPFVPQDFSGQYIYALITAFGGIPIDNRTNPPTINFTDPATIDAIRQVLDLIKDGYIEFSELGARGGGAVFSFAAGEGETNPISTQSLGAFGFLLQVDDRGEVVESNYEFVTYPRGSRYTPLTFDVSTAYISAEATNPPACYRFISEIARHPDLFSTMPARRSMLNDPALAAEEAALYRQIDALLSDPNTVITAPVIRGGGSPGAIWQQYWLRQAFNHYVQNDADLDAELAQAEMFTRDYLTCAGGIAPVTAATPEDRFAYFEEFGNCARSVDPTVK